MDKYEFNIKVEQIKKLVNKNDFATAMKIADTIDWRRVRNANLLSMISQVYEKNGEYQEAKEVLLLAFERAPISKRILYKLTELALKEGSLREAEDYYREFCDMAQDDSRQHLLRYMILKANGAPIDQLIRSLERFTTIELDEKWLFELAELYDKAGKKPECIQLCDKIILMFGEGTYVEQAKDLKQKCAPITNYGPQRTIYENYGQPSGGYVQGNPIYSQPSGGYMQGIGTYGQPQPSNNFMGDNYGQPSAGYPQGMGEYYQPEESYLQGTQGYGEMQNPYMPNGNGYVPPQNDYMQNPQEYGWQGNPYPSDNGNYPYQETDYVQQNGNYGEQVPPEYGYEERGYEPSDNRYMEENSTYGSAKDGSYIAEDEYDPYENGAYIQEDTGYVQDRPYMDQAPVYPSQRAWNVPGVAQGVEDVDEEIMANLHQAVAEKELAAEMSRISTEGYMETESPTDHTKVFKEMSNIRHINTIRQKAMEMERENEKEYRERSYVPHHLMIEAKTSDAGFETAVDMLKKIHRKTGVNNQVIKISGTKLSRRGIFNVSDKLAGKDLIVEEAGDLRQEDLEELQMLLERDETGMIVVLIDNPYQIEELHQQNPGFVNLFKCIRVEEEENSSTEELEEETWQPEEEEGDPEEGMVEPEPEEEIEEEEPVQREPNAQTIPQEQEEENTKDEYQETEEGDVEESYFENEEGEPEDEEEYDSEYNSEDEPEYDSEYNSEDEPEYDSEYNSEDEPEYDEDEEELDQYDEEEYYEDAAPIDDEEMDLNEFAEYAANYAREIDCSITGKSMLALCERIEIMEEDGIPLTRANAEDLIEEAADKAEKPSIGGLIKGVFSSKYDKEGLLILKEEHFI